MSYLSAKYPKIARLSLDFYQPFSSGDYHRKHLPNSEVVVLVIDDSRDATVTVDLQIIWGLLFALAEIKVDGLVRQPELFKNDGDFPKKEISF